MDKPSTIYDVAKLASTSAATVSRVLSDSTYPVSQKARQRVCDAATQLGYVPNTLAKSLRQLFERQVKGFILSAADTNSDLIKEYIQKSDAP